MLQKSRVKLFQKSVFFGLVLMEGSLAVRALQLSAYSSAIDALRASGQSNEQTEQLIQSLQKVFKISEVIDTLFKPYWK